MTKLDSPINRITAYYNAARQRVIAKETKEKPPLFGTKGVYAAFRLHPASVKAIRGWAKRNRIENIFPADEFHCTTVYSKKPIYYKPMGELNEPIKAQFIDFKLFGEEGDTIVLHIEHPLLHSRWKEAKDNGASWDFPSYVPHVSVSKNNSLTPEKVKQLTPIDFPIILTEEYVEPLDEDESWKAKVGASFVYCSVLYYLQPDGTWKKNGDGRSKGCKKEDLPENAVIAREVFTGDVEGKSMFAGINYDQVSGLGNVPDLQSVNYKGFVVQMPASVFLKLAAPRQFENGTSNIEGIMAHIRDGKPIGSPFLSVAFEKGKALVQSHEGRTRCAAIMKLFGPDHRVLVHIFGSYGRRAREITPEMIQGFRMKAKSQSGKWVNGPLFDSVVTHIGKITDLEQDNQVQTNAGVSDKDIKLPNGWEYVRDDGGTFLYRNASLSNMEAYISKDNKGDYFGEFTINDSGDKFTAGPFSSLNDLLAKAYERGGSNAVTMNRIRAYLIANN